ncbi:unnamed protein product [Periconia digitata]|uniref:Uncharacterized protein n=1 Tax=Periconia digitata TaxID=1303443 RepID=A0A9W4U9G6_9PLEO|nr:unnamed protein product [Periconia digitata]
MPTRRPAPKKTTTKRKLSTSSINTARITRAKHTKTPTTETKTFSPTHGYPFQLSKALAQKIQSLILIARQIEAIWRGWFDGPRAAILQRMNELEIHYDTLRESTETDLRAACIASGHSPSAVLSQFPSFPPTHRVKGSMSVKPKIPNVGVFDLGYSVDKELREEARRDPNSPVYNDYYGGEEEEVVVEMLQPIGKTVGQTPLTRREKKRMADFTWKKNLRKTMESGMDVSPKGSEAVYW